MNLCKICIECMRDVRGQRGEFEEPLVHIVVSSVLTCHPTNNISVTNYKLNNLTGLGDLEKSFISFLVSKPESGVKKY